MRNRRSFCLQLFFLELVSTDDHINCSAVVIEATSGLWEHPLNKHLEKCPIQDFSCSKDQGNPPIVPTVCHPFQWWWQYLLSYTLKRHNWILNLCHKIHDGGWDTERHHLGYQWQTLKRCSFHISKMLSKEASVKMVFLASFRSNKLFHINYLSHGHLHTLRFL